MFKSCPKVSIITVAFNAEETIQRCILSVSDQTWPNCEHLVKDGLSNDRTVEICELAGVKVIEAADSGIYDAMNQALSLASGEIICFLNADDYFEDHDAIRVVVEFMLEGNFEIVAGDIWYVDSTGSKLLYWAARSWSDSSFHQLPHAAFFAKSSLLSKLERPFDDSLLIAADLKQQVILYSQHKPRMGVISRPIANMSLGGLSTKSPWSYMRGWFESFNIYYSFFGLRAVFLVINKVIQKIAGVRKLSFFSRFVN